MKLAISALASGSSGNCYVIASDNTTILVDAGISGKQIFKNLQDLSREKIDAALITHEHSDHIKGLAALKTRGVKVYTNQKTLEAIEKIGLETDAEIFETGSSFLIGDIQVSSFSVSHDAADPCGFSFSKDDSAISIITDTGYVTPDCYKYMQCADILVLESNHDESMLRVGRYPWFLKQRILGKKGHLSNEAAANALLEVLKLDELSGRQRQRLVLLAHLSKENNFPEMAKATMGNILESNGFSVGKTINIITLERDNPSPLYIL